MIIGLARNLIRPGWIDRFHQLFIDNALRNTHQLEFYDRFYQDTSKYAHQSKSFRGIKAYSNHLQTRIYYQREKPVTRNSIDAFYLQGKVCREGGISSWSHWIVLGGYWWRQFERRTCGKRDRFDFEPAPPARK